MKTAKTRPEPRWWKGIVGLLAAIIVVLTVAGPSMAATGSVPTGGMSAASGMSMGPLDPVDTNSKITSRGVCTADIDAEGQLPVTRWDEGTDFHDRLHGSRPGDIAKSLQRQGLVSFMFGIGNTAWAVTTGMTETAINFCVLDKVGGVIDRTAADLGEAILGSGLLALLVVASVVVFLWRVGRSQGGGANTSALFQKAVVLGMFGVMIAGASASTGGGVGPNPDAAYKPGVGAPGWFITQIDQVVSKSAALLAGSVEQESIDGAEVGPAGRASLGCAPYVKSLKSIYRSKHGTEFGSEAAATVPLLLSSMWETSGLEMWKQAQFGHQTIGTHQGKPYGYGDLMYCRMLEANVAAKRHPTTTYWDDSVSSVMSKTGALDKTAFGTTIRASGTMEKIPGYATQPVWHTNGENLAWRYSSSNKVQDRFYVGWAACAAPMVDGEGNDPGAALVHENNATDTELQGNCNNFFTETDWDGGGGTGEFDWDESNDDITGTDTSSQAEDFLLTLHGNRQSSGMVAGMVYVVSSLMIAGVFVLFSAAIIVAKVSALMMMLGIMFVLAFALAPNASMSKITDFAKQYLGLSLFAWGAQLIMSLIALVTAILINAGNQIVPGGPGDVMAIAWVGFAPVIAVFCLHFMFKKLRIPSPLKMSGGMAWGQMAASGAVGGAAGMGAGALMNRAGNRVKQRATQSGKNVTSKVVGKDRRSKMTPSGGEKPGTQAAGKDAMTKGAAGKDAQTKGADVDGPQRPGTDQPGAATGPRTGSPRDQQKSALGEAKAEKKEAKAFAKTDEGKALIGTRAKQARAAAGAGVMGAASKFKDKPLRATRNAALVGTGAVVLGAATGGLGLAAGAGLYAAKRRVEGSPERKAAMLRGEAVGNDVEALRAHKAQQQARNSQVQEEQSSMARAHAATQAGEYRERESRRNKMDERLGGDTAPGARANGMSVIERAEAAARPRHTANSAGAFDLQRPANATQAVGPAAAVAAASQGR